jgi:hypothetical protein
VRPANSPVRRVVALAGLAARWRRGGLLPAVQRILGADSPPAIAARSLADLVTPPVAAAFWRRNWDFGRAAPAGAGALVGPSRAADVVVNVLLPLAATADVTAAAARAVYGAFPALAENWITRLVRQRTGTGELPPRAVVQQGLIATYETTCRDLHCAACPLGSGP